jgi:hypothetical protein
MPLVCPPSPQIIQQQISHGARAVTKQINYVETAAFSLISNLAPFPRANVTRTARNCPSLTKQVYG